MSIKPEQFRWREAFLPIFFLTPDEFLQDIRDYGLFRTVLVTVLVSGCQSVKFRIRHYILDPQVKATDQYQEAMAIKNSYIGSLPMIAVAAAIIAQIAVTALSLPSIGDVHWTAEACFIVSLLTGLFSVYYCCLLYVRLSELHSGENVRVWLVKSRAACGQSEIPSLSTIIQLVQPVQLLNISVCVFVVGIGVYYGQIYTKMLGTAPGDNANLAILIVYILTAAGAVIFYYGLESHREEELLLPAWALKLNATQASNDQGNDTPTHGHDLPTAGQFPSVHPEDSSAKSFHVLHQSLERSIQLQEAKLAVLQDLAKTMAGKVS